MLPGENSLKLHDLTHPDKQNNLVASANLTLAWPHVSKGYGVARAEGQPRHGTK